MNTSDYTPKMSGGTTIIGAGETIEPIQSDLPTRLARMVNEFHASLTADGSFDREAFALEFNHNLLAAAQSALERHISHLADPPLALSQPIPPLEPVGPFPFDQTPEAETWRTERESARIRSGKL